jgi:hypothetical protein
MRRIAWACIIIAQVSGLTSAFEEVRTMLKRAMSLGDKVGDYLAMAWFPICSGAVRVDNQ